MSARARGSLALRLFGLAVAQVVITVAVGDFLINRSREPRPPSNALPSLAADVIEPALDDPRALDDVLVKLARRDGLQISVYRDEGARELVATNVQPPLQEGAGMPPPGPPGASPPRGTGPAARFTHGGHGFRLIARVDQPGPSGLPPPMINLLAGIAIVAAWALLVGRWVVGPLRTLDRAARALGGGDLSARAKLSRRDEIGEVGHAFDDMAERLQKLLVAEKELLANVSHELRTPLARIRVALDLAREGDAEAARASLAEIAIDLGELESLIDDILTATRFDMAAQGAASALSLHREATTPQEIAQHAADRFRARHPDRALDVTIADDLAPIDVDRVLFRRTLDNLLENAHKYTPDRDAHVALHVTEVQASGASAQSHAMRFEVIDRGMGIPEEDLPHVFTPFFRGEKSRSRAGGGVGLGLTLAKRIVEAHGGSISAKSDAAGTVFRVEIPAAPKG